VLRERAALRYTPAGIEALDLHLEHTSEQDAGGRQQRVELELQAVAFAHLARRLQHAQPGQTLQLAGFLMPVRRGARSLKLNITEWIEEP
jgi:primosomal replication protein N